ncbi:GTP-binding protein [Clostridium septicum]|uniref:Elongation factor G n=1 Tax=Clostridium septicum TaxID=1504 RepID=A0A9N7JM91_CLOSE|nr:TetM/TetW/TetO/TetS family tetracycline resistance ribosomal protection protein [Clostridium septicum]AYE35249.1 elongation factor G [Clostridium septicum]MDU1313671.1 TetM/TetW/TetO/TetS family tetracycline resistance ribosomal protection protein [Clostridium septicum]QAS60644.1 GTP-binding protein [Clostridium septicum]UEC20101.1 TetM/TetW/TetO/TetS family tetracycline resistance ribosomal protection protein [Clostridium septicum]USS01843.1 TetM/TetW/TetO/TetS family tetracycline resistan
MRKTIGILAHVDAGKTTLAEQILYHTKSIRSRGRVDHKNSFLDSHNIERERGITVFSDQGIFQYNNSKYYLIDTPGHADFSSEMERGIQIMDYAILILSAVDGIQGHSETVWSLLKKHKIPTFIFINKMDRVGVNLNEVIEEIKDKFTKDICIIKNYLKENLMDETFIDFIVEKDDELLEKYLEGNYKEEDLINCFKKIIKENKAYPVFLGSALQDVGIEEFINNLDLLTYTNYNEDEKFSGKVYKIKHDNDGTKLTYIKALSGSLKIKEEIEYGKAENRKLDKINQIRIYNGNKYKNVDKISAGDIFAVVGLTEAISGDGVGEFKETSMYNMVPTLKSKVIYSKDLNPKDILKIFKILEAEDPALNVVWDEVLKELQINIMGVIQLEILKELVKERFKVDISFGPCEILYKETIEGETIGYGHFEPLKHYAEVHLKIEEGKRNSGIIFKNKCHTDNLTVGQQNLVKTHIYEKDHNGILIGSPITDLEITLLTGKAHDKHTSGGDFREATFRALRQGLEKAKNILLEPYYSFNINMEVDYMGRVLSDIQKLNGVFEIKENKCEKINIVGRGPVSTFMDYSKEFIALTKGKGKISFVFDGYDICHNENEVINKISYDKNADINYSSSSIFCSKGEGFIVPWNEAEEYMHLLK